MTFEKEGLDKEFFYDFRETRFWYKTFAGSSMSQQMKPSLFLETYRIFAFLFLIMMTFMFFITALLTTKYLADFSEAFHYCCILLTMAIYIPAERLAKNDIDKTFQKLKKCFYVYNGELNESQKDIKRKTIAKIKFTDKVFFWVLIFVCVLYSILTPLKDYFYPHLRLERSEIIDRKLPIPFYVPFEDRYNIIFIIVFLMECCCNMMVHSLITSIHEAYISLTGQIYGEMKLLNYSLSHIEERAIKLYLSKDLKRVKSIRSIYKLTAFKKCFEECLKEDLIHHKVLLSCIKLVRPFTGRIIISVFTLCSIVWAVGIYVISQMIEQGTAMDKVLEFLLMLFTEGVYVFDMCLFNEKIKSEMDELFIQIYSIPWYNCDRKFCQNVHLMLMNTMKPTQLNKNLFNVSASFETLMPIISAAFSYFNVLRNIRN
nr:odorant receptor 13 [Graphosoma rubrolineatum]